MIAMRETDKCVVIDVRVQPKGSSDRIMGEHDGALKVSVTAAPEAGKANAAVIKLLSKALRIPKSSIEIVAGDTSRTKRLRLTGVAAKDIQALL